MTKNIKISLSLIYIICLGALLYSFFYFIDISQLNNYSYIRDNSQFLIEVKDQNFIGFTFLYILFVIIWILLLGFASPIALVAGFLFGKFFGTLISVFAFTTGCTLLYFLANSFFKTIIMEKFSNKISKYKKLFNKNEFFYYMIFRLAGGGGIPFAIQNLLPVIFNMRVKNYFFSTLIGLFPVVFVMCSIGSGIENIIQQNINPSFFSMIQTKEIYLPLLGFIGIIIFSSILRKKFFKR
jgi:uncharacterized membrane protein YdjX (TVP38/TMEM64 family)